MKVKLGEKEDRLGDQANKLTRSSQAYAHHRHQHPPSDIAQLPPTRLQLLPPNIFLTPPFDHLHPRDEPDTPPEHQPTLYPHPFRDIVEGVLLDVVDLGVQRFEARPCDVDVAVGDG